MMAYVTIKGLDELRMMNSRLDKLVNKGIPNATRKGVVRFGKLTKTFLQQKANQARWKPNTGNLARSVRLNTRGNRLNISMLGYGEYVEKGTRRHNMNKNGRGSRIPIALRKGWAGNNKHPFMMHPGARPRPFITEAVNKANTHFNRIMSKGLDKAIINALRG